MSKNENQNNEVNPYLAYGVSFGLLAGVVAGAVLMALFDTILVSAVTPGLGMLVGTAVAQAMNSKNNEDN